MPKLIAAFHLLILLLFSGCGNREQLSSAEQAGIETAVRQMLEDYNAAVKKKGLTGEFEYLDTSSQFFWAPPGYNSAISYDSVAAILKRNANHFRSIDNSFESLKIFPLAPHLASYTGKLRSHMTDTSGRKSTYTMLETGIIIKRPDGWKLLSGQTTLLSSN